MKGQKYHVDMFQQMQKESPKVVAMIMTQLSMKAGLKAGGDPAKAAVKEEIMQLHMRDTFQPRHWKTLTPEEKERLLESHLFLKKKRGGKIKGRTVAWKQTEGLHRQVRCQLPHSIYPSFTTHMRS